MKIAFGSDLHFEFGVPRPSLDADAGFLVLAGDIDRGRGGPYHDPLVVEHAKAYADKLGIPVVVVLGNHEFYGEEFKAFLRDSRSAAAEHELVYLLENDAVEIGGVRFLGCTLWSDFKLGNDEAFARREAYLNINDYELISIKDEDGQPRSLTPVHTAEFNSKSRVFLEAELAKPFDGPTVVVTHFPPIFMSAPEFEGGSLSAYFCNDWRSDIENGTLSPDVWIAGHTHHSADMKMGKTRIVSRQGGYPGELGPFEWGVVELNV